MKFSDYNNSCGWCDDNTGLGVRNNNDRGLAKLPYLEPAVIL